MYIGIATTTTRKKSIKAFCFQLLFVELIRKQLTYLLDIFFLISSMGKRSIIMITLLNYSATNNTKERNKQQQQNE